MRSNSNRKKNPRVFYYDSFKIKRCPFYTLSQHKTIQTDILTGNFNVPKLYLSLEKNFYMKNLTPLPPKLLSPVYV